MVPIMFFHVAAGSIGIVSGAAALSVRKGGRVHRASGQIFLLSMLAAASLGAYLGLLAQRGGLFVGGILACYMLATAWMTVRRPACRIGYFERAAPVAAFALAALLAAFGLHATNSPTGQFEGIPAAAYLGQAVVAALAGTLDVRVVLRGGISGRPRIVRHLWRVCLAFFEATSAFFLGQQKIMPVFMHGSPILLVLGITPMILMLFWLARMSVVRDLPSATGGFAPWTPTGGCRGVKPPARQRQ